MENETEVKNETQKAANYADVAKQYSLWDIACKSDKAFYARFNQRREDLTLLEFDGTDNGAASALFFLFDDCFSKNESLGVMAFDGKKWSSQNADDMLRQCAVLTIMARKKLVDAQLPELRSRLNDLEKILKENGQHSIKGLTALNEIEELKPKFAIYTEIGRRSIANQGNIYAAVNLAMISIRYVPVQEFDNQPYLFNANNGVIDLRSGQILEHSPEFYFTVCSKRNYVPGAYCGRFSKFLDDVILLHSTDETVQEYIHKSFGYLLTGYTTLEKLYYFYGPQGRNGKGTIITILEAILDDSVMTAAFGTFTKHRGENDQGFDLAPMVNKRLITASESNESERFNSATIKNMTGGDKINACFKHKTPFNYRPKYKLVLSSNFVPTGAPDDVAYWNRYHLVYFPNSYIGREDTTLKLYLSTNEEALEGIFNWIVDGAIHFFNDGMKITQPTQYVKLLETYRSQNDTVAQWLDASTLHSKLSVDALSETDKAQLEKIAESKGFTLETFIADGIRVPIMYKELFSDYRKYCESEGITSALHTKKFYDSLRNKGYTDLRRITVGGVQERYFTGVIPFVGTGGLVETALVAAKDLPFAVNQAVQLSLNER